MTLVHVLPADVAFAVPVASARVAESTPATSVPPSVSAARPLTADTTFSPLLIRPP
jgi:hypothetical protein